MMNFFLNLLFFSIVIQIPFFKKNLTKQNKSLFDRWWFLFKFSF